MKKEIFQNISFDRDFINTYPGMCIPIELNDEEQKYLTAAYRVIEPVWGQYNAPDVIAFLNDGRIKLMSGSIPDAHVLLADIIDNLEE